MRKVTFVQRSGKKVRNLSREKDCFKCSISSKSKGRGQYVLVVKKNESNRPCETLKNMSYTERKESTLVPKYEYKITSRIPSVSYEGFQ